MAEEFFLKYRDTRPILQVTLYDPAPEGSLPNVRGDIHDLTGSTDWFLHILLSSGVALIRDMTVVGDPTDGTLEYIWVLTDWDAPSAPDSEGSYTIGGLEVGPSRPLSPTGTPHRMEYEVLGESNARQTFPNDDYDILWINSDIGQGA